jgi:Rrf2 family protein
MYLYTREKFLVAILVDLAISGTNGPITLKTLASRNNTTVNYLEKIFAYLREDRIVECVLGNRGGYKIGARGLNITIYEILSATSNYGQKESDHSYSEPVANMTDEIWTEIEKRSLDQFKSLTLGDFILPEIKRTLNEYG